MRSTPLDILTAIIVQASYQEPAASTGNVQEFIARRAPNFTDNTMGDIFDRSLKVSSLRTAYLDSTTVGKSGHAQAANTNMNRMLRAVAPREICCRSWMITHPFLDECAHCRSVVKTSRALPCRLLSNGKGLGSKRVTGVAKVTGMALSTEQEGAATMTKEQERAMTWFNLGAQGGGDHEGITYSQKECYEKALASYPDYGIFWNNLGVVGGGEVNGRTYPAKECYEKALAIEPKLSVTWFNIGVINGGQVAGHTYLKQQCYEKALSNDPKLAVAWSNLGVLGGGEVNGQMYSKKECYQNALSSDSEIATTWSNLGTIGGGVINGTKYSQQQCYEKALEKDPELAAQVEKEARKPNSRARKQQEASLQLHAEKKALAVLLAEGEPELSVTINFNACIDCHEFFKAASLMLGRRISLRQPKMVHHMSGGGCSCNDRWRWEARLSPPVTDR